MKKGIGNKICLVWERFKTKRTLVCSRERCLCFSPFHSNQDQSPRIRASITQTLIYRAFGCRRSARLRISIYCYFFDVGLRFFYLYWWFPLFSLFFFYVHESTKNWNTTQDKQKSTIQVCNSKALLTILTCES